MVSAALEAGFHQCGVAQVAPIDESRWGYGEWLHEGFHGSMDYMANHVEMRHDPRLLLPGARSVVSLLLGYRPSAVMRGNAKIAQYAYGEDYHSRIKRMLFALIKKMDELCPGQHTKPCVDTVPISDKLWAVRAGLGWIGRNTLFISPLLGSYCNIAEIVTTAEFDIYDEPVENRCGDCRLCVQSCPNHAIVEKEPNESNFQRYSLLDSKFSVDARRCTAYNTIENRSDSLPEGLDRRGYAFGCDCCQLACPYNRTAKVCVDMSEDQIAELEGLEQADEAQFKHFARNRALNRIKYWQWRRNISS